MVMTMEQEKTDFLNKQVVIVKTDKFKKIGKLLSTDNNLAIIEFRNGVREAIPFSQISSIKLIGDGDGR